MLHCVPFPDAGAPAMIILGGGVDPAAAASMAIPSLRVAPLAAAAGTHVRPLTLPLLAVVPVGGGGANAEAGRVEIEAAQSEGFGTPPNQLRVVAVLPTGGTKAEASVLVLAVAVTVATAAAAPSAPPPGGGAKAAAVRHAARLVRRTTRPTMSVVIVAVERMRDGMVGWTPAWLLPWVCDTSCSQPSPSGGRWLHAAPEV